MKKFYAFALAAAVTLSASAAVKGNHVAHQKDVKLPVLKEASLSTLSLEKKFVEGNDALGTPRKAPRKAAETMQVPMPLGTFACIYQSNTAAGTKRTATDMVEIYEDFMGDGVYLYNMFGMGGDTPCEITAIEWQVDAAGNTEVYPNLLIEGMGEQEAFTYNGTTYSYFLGENGESITLYGDDITWIINEETHTLEWPWGEGFGIAFANLDLGRAYYIDNPSLYLTNGTLEALVEAVDYDAMEYYMTPYEESVFALKTSNTLLFPTILESVDMLQFTLTADGTAVAANQVFWDATSQGYGVFMWSNVGADDSIDYGNLTGKLTDNVLSIGGPNWCQFSTTVEDYYGYGEETTVTFDFDYTDAEWPLIDVDVEGVKGVEVDNNNAPVEYFNLQGVRVSNPENGIFIRRQGNNAVKVVK